MYGLDWVWDIAFNLSPNPYELKPEIIGIIV